MEGMVLHAHLWLLIRLVRFVDNDPSTVGVPLKLSLSTGEEPPCDPDDDTGITASLDPGPLPIKVCACMQCMHVVHAGCACSVCCAHARVHSCVRE